MAQMTECVASSISRWHGCKAEYYLLSCSTHSDLRWRGDGRRGPSVYFSEAATNKLLPQALNRGERHRIADTASYLYTKVELLGRNSSPRTPNLGKNKMRIYFSAAGQSFGHFGHEGTSTYVMATRKRTGKRARPASRSAVLWMR